MSQAEFETVTPAFERSPR